MRLLAIEPLAHRGRSAPPVDAAGAGLRAHRHHQALEESPVHLLVALAHLAVAQRGGRRPAAAVATGSITTSAISARKTCEIWVSSSGTATSAAPLRCSRSLHS